MANTYWKFRLVDDFDYDKNRRDCFDVADMNGIDLNYKLVLASECPTDINDCLDEYGTLKEYDSTTGKGVKILNTFGEEDGLISLLYNHGVNGESSIACNATSVSYELSDSIDYIKGIFLVSYGNGSGYVMAYSINNAPLELQDDQLILNVDGLVWGTHYTGV